MPPTSDLNAVLDARYADQYTLPTVLHVDPANGADRYDGGSWKRAKATIQAAVDAAPVGAEIILAPGAHTVGAGVVCPDNRRNLTIRGASPLAGRQHADDSYGQTHLTSGLTGTDRPTALIRVGSDKSTNTYGWTFKNMYFDADTIAPGGAFLETHAVNRASLEGIAGRTLAGDEEATRYVLRSDAGGGDDGSWWRFHGISTMGVGLAVMRNSNYLTVDAVSIMGHTGVPLATGPALVLDVASQPNLSGLHLEGWAVGVHATGVRGLLGIGIASEWVGVLVHMVGCWDSVVAANSAAGAGPSEVIDEAGRNNMVIGAPHRKVNTTQAHTVSSYGTTATQLSAGSASPIYGAHPNRPVTGVEILPVGSIDVAGSAPITAEYHDGGRWVPWRVDTGALSATNTQGITVDAAHARVRFRSGNLYGHGQGLAYLRATQHQGEASTVTFRLLDDAGMPVHEYTTVLNEPAQKRGALASFPEGYNHNVFEVEVRFGLTGGQTATVSRVHLYATDSHDLVRGRASRGPVAPEGVIRGAASDIYHCTGRHGEDPDIGLWVHTGPSGVTGWRKLAYA